MFPWNEFLYPLAGQWGRSKFSRRTSVHFRPKTRAAFVRPHFRLSPLMINAPVLANTLRLRSVFFLSIRKKLFISTKINIIRSQQEIELNTHKSRK